MQSSTQALTQDLPEAKTGSEALSVEEIAELVSVGQAETDGQVIKMWLWQKSQRSQNTARIYEHEFSRFKEICSRPLADLRISDLQLYREHLDGLGLARASQARALSTIRSLFTFARKIGYLQFNPSEVMELPKVTVNSEGHFLKPGEVQALLDALRPRMRNYLIGALALKTGLRVAELAGIDWGHFYQDPIGRVGLTVVGKGDKVRTVKITPDVWSVIAAYRQSSEKPVELDAEDKEPLFLNRYGKRLSMVSLWQVIKDGARVAGIRKNISPHWLRHTHGALAIIGGATLSQVRSALGHSDIRTTQRYEQSAQALADTAADYVGITV
jgi:site-specific recombinase XerD